MLCNLKRGTNLLDFIVVTGIRTNLCFLEQSKEIGNLASVCLIVLERACIPQRILEGHWGIGDASDAARHLLL